MMQQRNENRSVRRDKSGVTTDEARVDAKADEAKKVEEPAAKPTSSPPPPGSADAQIAKRGGRIVLIVLVVIGVAALAYHYMISGQGQQAAATAPPAPPVTVAKPLVKELREWRDFTGQFAAPDAVEIRARVSGYLESVNFTDGQLVKQGDLLFVIEPKPFEIALENAKAQLAQAEAQLQLAQAQLERTAQLRKNDYASQETYDERVAQVNVAKATRDSASAEVDQAKLNLAYTRVMAPVSGRVGQHEVSIGNLVMGGVSGTTTLLTTIVSLDPIWLEFNVSEGDGMAYKRLMQKGEVESARDNNVEVQGQLMDETNWPLKGTIDFVDNQYDRTSGTIRVRATFPNPNLFITPGQFGRVRVPMSQEKPTMLVPDAAVVTDQSVKMLFTVAEDGTVVPKPVELGSLADDNLRIIKSGITPDDTVIINGLLRARPGQKITPEAGEIKPPSAAPESQQ